MGEILLLRAELAHITDFGERLRPQSLVAHPSLSAP